MYYMTNLPTTGCISEFGNKDLKNDWLVSLANKKAKLPLSIIQQDPNVLGQLRKNARNIIDADIEESQNKVLNKALSRATTLYSRQYLRPPNLELTDVLFNPRTNKFTKRYKPKGLNLVDDNLAMTQVGAYIANRPMLIPNRPSGSVDRMKLDNLF